MICLNCNKQFEAKSRKAIFCSTRCRVAKNRNKTPRIVTDVKEPHVEQRWHYWFCEGCKGKGLTYKPREEIHGDDYI